MTAPARFSSAVQALLDGTGLVPVGPERVASLAGCACADVVRFELRLQKTSRGRVLRVPVATPAGRCALTVAVLPFGRTLHVDETITALALEAGRAQELLVLAPPGATTAYRSCLELDDGPVTTERAYVVDGTRVLALGSRTRARSAAVPLEDLLRTAPEVLWRRT